jgi:hypothetical protein
MLLQDRQYLLGDSPGDVELVIPGFLVEIADGRPRDGPASDRVAVVDLTDGGRAARPPAKLLPPKGARRVRSFAFDEELLDPDLRDPVRFEDDTFVQLHCFACVHATLGFFEQLLGRRIAWPFAAEQLSIVPWAGTDRKASYDRASGSIKLFEYESDDGRRILTALSRDIVAHEAAHAILDAVAPDLNDAADPDSLTIHEAVGDLSALLQTLVDEKMLFSIYAISGGGATTWRSSAAWRRSSVSTSAEARARPRFGARRTTRRSERAGRPSTETTRTRPLRSSSAHCSRSSGSAWKRRRGTSSARCSRRGVSSPGS